MKTLHPARKRLLIGFLLLAATFFYAFAPTCGLVGQLVHRATATLLGQTGSTLLALVMLGVGLMLVIPHGAVGGMVRWVAHGREARVGRVVREMATLDRTREFKRLVAEAVADARGETPSQSRVVSGTIETKVTPVERMKLDAIRGVLKQLGYKAHEYESIVAGLDPKPSEEVLVRAAIKQLRPRSN